MAEADVVSYLERPLVVDETLEDRGLPGRTDGDGHR